MGHYKSNVRDLEFNLFEALDIEKALSTGQFGDLTAEQVRGYLREAADQAEGPLSAAFFDGDRQPPTFDPDTHTVTLPATFKDSVRVWLRGPWLRLGLAAGIGGVSAPAMLRWAINEFLVAVIMEFARMAVGSKAIATLSTGYLNALDYAKSQQGGLADAEVRRSLMLQKSYAEGMRALYLYTAAHQDDVAAAAVSGADPAMARRVNDLLLPIVKGVGSERSYQCLAESLQILGGAGYLQDQPFEQYIRDAKIDSLYEGTTAIQAQDFCFRKIMRDGGEALGFVTGQIESFLADPQARPEIADARRLLATALADVRAIVAALTNYFVASRAEPREVYPIGLGSVPFLLAVGDLLIGWLLLQHAEIALRALDGDVAIARSTRERSPRQGFLPNTCCRG